MHEGDSKFPKEISRPSGACAASDFGKADVLGSGVHPPHRKRRPDLLKRTQELTISEEAALLEAARTGGRTEVDALVRYLMPHIHRRVASELFRRSQGSRWIRWEVEDAVHEVWAKLLSADWRVLHRWDPAQNVTLRGFVGRVARQELIDVQRSGRKTPFLEEPAPPSDLEHSAAESDLEQQVEEHSFLGRFLAVLEAKLSPTARELFGVMYLGDLDVLEVAARTGLTVSAVYSHRKRIAKLAVEAAREVRDEEA